MKIAEALGRSMAAIPLCVFMAAVAVFVAASPYARTDFPLDDSWIHQVYARSFARGQGFEYNQGAQEAGSTSPLWVVVTAPVHWLEPLGGTELVVLGVKAVGVLLGGGSVLLLYLIARSLTGSAVSAGIGALLLALEPRLIFSALSGMETVLLVALWLGVIWAALERRYVLSMMCLGLMPVTRPESVIILPLILAGIAALGGGCDGVWRRPSAWLVLGFPSAAWAGLCWRVNGHLLPNTFYRKASAFALGTERADVAWRSLTQQGWGSAPWLWLGIVAFCAWLAIRNRRDSLFAGAVLVLAPVLYVMGVLGSRLYSLDGYYWTRWVDPAVLILTCSQAMGLSLLLGRRSWIGAGAPAGAVLARLRGRTVATSVVVVAGIVILGSLPRWAASFGERRARLASDSRAIYLTNVEPAIWIRDNTSADAVVGAEDAGAIRFFGGRKTIDLLGLNYADLALRRVDLREAGRQLDWIVAFPAWLDGSVLAGRFVPRKWFRMPEAEYTVCPCPTHTTVVVASREGLDPGSDPADKRTAP